jgi:hypothetical protein
MKKLMVGFLAIGFFLITSWAFMFYSYVFRWTFMKQVFFASFMAESLVVMAVSCMLGVICWRNFDKGLAHYRSYLHIEVSFY